MLLVLFLLLGGVNELKMYLGFYTHRSKDKKEISQNLWGLVALLFLLWDVEEKVLILRKEKIN